MGGGSLAGQENGPVLLSRWYQCGRLPEGGKVAVVASTTPGAYSNGTGDPVGASYVRYSALS